MLIALGVTGGIGAYKAVEVARGLQKRGHEVVAVMTAAATRFVGPRDLRSDHAAAGHHRSVRARRQRRHRAHRAGLVDRSAAHRAGDREHPRQAGQRHRRRFSVHALHRDQGAGARRAGDEHADVRARGGPPEPRDARGARRALRRAGRGLPGVRLDWQRPARGARRDRRRGRDGAAAGGAAARRRGSS